MSESAGKYTIKIETVHDGSGAKDALADLKAMEKATKETNEFIGKGEAEQAEKSKLQSREFRNLLREAGGGQIGLLLKTVTEPLFLAFAAAIEVYEQLEKRQEAHQEQLRKEAEDTEHAADMQRDFTTAMSEGASDAVSKLTIFLDHLDDSYNELAASIKNAADAAADHATQMERIARATLAAAQAQVALNEALGNTAPVVAHDKLAHLEQEAKERAQRAEDKKDSEDAARKDEEAREATKREQEATAKVKAAQAPGGEKYQADALVTREQSTVNDLIKQHDEAKKKYDEMGPIADEFVAAVKSLGKVEGLKKFFSDNPLMATTNMPQYVRDAETAKNLYHNTSPEAAEARLAEYKRQQESAEANLKAAQAEISRFHEETRQATQTRDEILRKAGERSLGNRGENDAAYEAIQFKRQTEEANTSNYPIDPRTRRPTATSTADRDLMELSNLVKLAEAGQNVDARWNQLIAELVQLFKSGLIKNGMDLAGLQREMEDIKSQHAANNGR